jgi:glycosyltransferase involved in cell wall biosynthesis
VVSVARLEAMKGFAVLAEAVGAVAREGVPVRLTLIGDGAERPALERAARAAGVADAVRFTAALGAPEVARRLAAADVFCLPSFAEGVPVVLMEAMAAACPWSRRA